MVVGNCTGFAVNRVFFPYTQAACMLVDLGLDPYRIDRAVAGWGMPMGPFRCRPAPTACQAFLPAAASLLRAAITHAARCALSEPPRPAAC